MTTEQERRRGPAGAALLLIDLVNPMEFEGGDALFRHAVPAARNIARLTRRARCAGVPVIYTNDNFGFWHLGFRELVHDVSRRSSRGGTMTALLEPDPGADHFVLKPRHSAFFQTGLEFLLQQLGVTTLVLTGVATEICVLFTANDAHMRCYRVAVPSDCVASERVEDHDYALRLMARLLGADVRDSTALELEEIAARSMQAARREG